MGFLRTPKCMRWNWLGLSAFSFLVGATSLARYLDEFPALFSGQVPANHLIDANGSLIIAIVDFSLAIIFAAFGLSPIEGNKRSDPQGSAESSRRY